MKTRNFTALTERDAVQKVRAAEDAWNTHDLNGVVLASTIDCHWRSRAEFLWGREQIKAYLARKWRQEFEQRLVNELWTCERNRVAIRFSCEFRDDSGTWFRAYGNEHWQCDADGLVRRRLTCANEHPIQERERAFRWPIGIRPAGHPTLSELGF